MSFQTPEAIQAESFRIIDELLAAYNFPSQNAAIVKRVIHATGDPSWADELVIHPQAVSAACKAMKAGCPIVTDVQMVRAGINGAKVKALGGKLVCGIKYRKTSETARKEQITRAAAAMRLLAKQWSGGILAIGNAPSALFEVCQLIRQGKPAPALIIGVPVGFVGSEESKTVLRELSVPYITNTSRKGGSPIAVAIVNALLELSLQK
ncbi:MAG: precorrin-8X methylmutase [Candidatus Schekmanbacteria bacterium]|nr:precorrin-8X methylmutase [Candidatus Schekmanbacteria bacterium]